MKTLMRNGRDRRSENPFLGHAKKERVSLFGTDLRITSGPAARRPHSKAEYMTAPERFADSQIPLAPRAPSIHDPKPTRCALKRVCFDYARLPAAHRAVSEPPPGRQAPVGSDIVVRGAYCGTRQALNETINQRSPRFSHIAVSNVGALTASPPAFSLPDATAMPFDHAVSPLMWI